MAKHDLPIEFILSRSLSEGIVKKEDPNLLSLRLSKSKATKLASFPSQPLKNNLLNTINGSNKYSTRVDSSSFADHRYKSVSGYGLADSSSEESESDFSDNDNDYSFGGKRSMTTISSTSTRVSETRSTTRQNRTTYPNSHVDYVAHITGRIDPWELQIQKLRDEGKELTPQLTDRIMKDFRGLGSERSGPLNSRPHDNEDIAQRLRSMAIEVETIKDKRKKETEAMNHALSKDIDDCLARIKEERDTAIRIREEALKQEQLEKERVAKEAEDNKKAAMAEKEAQEKKAKEASAAAEAATAAKAKKIADDAAKKASLATSNAAGVFVSQAADKERQHYKSVLDYIHNEVVVAIDSNKAVKKSCADAKREIVPLIGQLINVRDEILRVAITIDGVFKKIRDAHGDNGYYWIMNIAAKKFVSDTPELYMKKLGYARKDKGWESEAQYDARQCAIFSLYCAIMQTEPTVGRNIYPITHAWTWMARVLNMPPRTITPALISSFVDVCGHVYLSTYRNQALKIFRLTMTDFIPMVPKEGVAGATRLKTQLEDFMKSGHIPKAEGRDTPN
ncbi:Nuclear pore complex nucleoporin component [Podila horticola]|nr:Nuclear pore complex nucleoporin component [Podila horticola]